MNEARSDFDTKPIAELQLAATPAGEQRLASAEPDSNVMVPVMRIDEDLAKYTRDTFAACGATVVRDIEALGCTGLVHHGVTIEGAKRARAGLAGSGAGLPCYVAADRYCLVHEVIGGLQDGQLQRFPEAVEATSRPLAPSEIAHRELVETARRSRGGSRDAADALSGRKLPDNFLTEVTEAIGSTVEPSPELPPPAPSAVPTPAVAPLSAEDMFRCPEHATTFWDCRYCVAAEIVKGDYKPVLLFESRAEGARGIFGTPKEIEAKDVEGEIASCDASNDIGAAVLFVKVAQWSRKLARD